MRKEREREDFIISENGVWQNVVQFGILFHQLINLCTL
jgi:hypothetical protein